MAEKPQIAMTEDALVRLAEAIKTPYRDPVVEERKAKQRKAMIAERDAMNASRAQEIANCSHLREDNTSCIAWHEFAIGRHPSGEIRKAYKGVCQHCNGFFEPGHPEYTALLRIPTRSAATSVMV